MLRELVIFLALTSIALAATSRFNLEPKPDKYKDKEGCYISDLDEVIPFGSSAPCKKHCMAYRCGSNHVQVVTCGVAHADPPCILEEDHHKPYPECCPKIKCP